MAVTIHGKFGTRVYKAWVQMLQRCKNPRQDSYKSYGGRGITVCAEWHQFTNFYADMGDPPPRMSLDRIDNEGNYEPGNCRWADQATQQNNKRNNNVLTLATESATLAQWSRRTGLGATTIKERLRRGWTVADALTISADGYNPKRADLAADLAARISELDATEPPLALSLRQLGASGICRRGHRLTDDTSYFVRNRVGNIKRRCSICMRRATRRRRLRAAAIASVPATAPV